MKDPGIGSRARVRLSGAPASEDAVVVEEPLALTIDGERWLTVMRTPGEDPDLVLGLLFAEGCIDEARDVSAIVRCAEPDDPADVLDVRSGPGRVITAPPRATLSSSACGVCGRERIDDLLPRSRVGTGAVARSVLRGAPARLRPHQPRFAATGALHGAALLDDDGEVLAAAEDVGRHNAVDKVFGRALREERLPRAHVLVVSARGGFEIVQKAVVAGVDAVVCVSGASSLAIDLARAAGLVLVAFARDGDGNVYAGEDRLG